MDKEQIIIEVTSATSTVRLNGPMQHDKFRVRWVQVVGANFPGDTVYVISMSTADVMNIGVTTASNLAIAPHRAIVVPLTAATSTYTFDDALLVLDRSVHGQVRNRSSNAQTVTVGVQSNVTVSPTFTRLTVCLESA